MLKYINNNKNIQLIGCCSLNDKEIRKMKIYDLFGIENDLDDMKRDDIIFLSIEEVIRMDNYSIDEGGVFDKAFDKIGKTIKNYNILSFFYKSKKNELNNFIDEQRLKIKKNILEFYNINFE